MEKPAREAAPAVRLKLPLRRGAAFNAGFEVNVRS